MLKIIKIIKSVKIQYSLDDFQFLSTNLTWSTVQDPRLTWPHQRQYTREVYSRCKCFLLKCHDPNCHPDPWQSYNLGIWMFCCRRFLCEEIRKPSKSALCTLRRRLKGFFGTVLAFSSIRWSLNLHGKISARLFGNFTFPSPVGTMFLHHVSGWKFRQKNNIESSAQMNRSLPMCFINEMFYFWKQFQSCAF